MLVVWVSGLAVSRRLDKGIQKGGGNKKQANKQKQQNKDKQTKELDRGLINPYIIIYKISQLVYFKYSILTNHGHDINFTNFTIHLNACKSNLLTRA